MANVNVTKMGLARVLTILESEKDLIVLDPDDKTEREFIPTMQLIEPLYRSPKNYPENLLSTDVNYLKKIYEGKHKAIVRLDKALKAHFSEEASRVMKIPGQPHLQEVELLATDGIGAIPESHWYDLSQLLANVNSSGYSIEFRIQVHEATNTFDFELESFWNDVLDYLVMPEDTLSPYYTIGEISAFNEYAIEQFMRLEAVLPTLEAYQDELDKLWSGEASKLTKETAGEYFNQLTVFMGAVTTAYEQQPNPL